MRLSHQDQIARLLGGYDAESLPLDRFVNQYFRSQKFLGARDRRVIGDTVFALIRWRGLLDAVTGRPFSWRARLEAFLAHDVMELSADASLPLHIRCSFPRWLFEHLSAAYGEEEAFRLCVTLNEEAPLTVRVNPLKTTREALLKAWEGVYPVKPTCHSRFGLTFGRRVQLLGLPEYRAGLFEIQDEASQLVAELVAASPGDRVLDYCAGSGGKSLAMAYKLEGRGQLFLHDVRRGALLDARRRLRRAGVQNAGVGFELQKGMDWVLVDAPCSGLGTLRRNVDMKWRLKPASLEQFIGLQRKIFAQALRARKPGGRMVYATCSILAEENSAQVAYFCEKYKLEVKGKLFATLPTRGGMDGFFASVLA